MGTPEQPIPKWVHPALISVVLMWGGVFIAIAKLLPVMDSTQLVTIRFVAISMAFIAIFLAVPSLRPRLSRREFAVLLVAGALAVPGAQLPVVQAPRYLSPALVSVFITLSPVCAALIARVFLKERFSPLQLAGFAVAFGGSVIVILTGTGTSDLTVDNPWGAALALITPFCWAAYTVMSKPLAVRYPPLTAIGLAMIAGTLVMAPLYPRAYSAVDDISFSGWLWVMYLVLAGTLITYWIWYKALAHMPASRTAAYLYGVPLAALAWSWAVLDDIPQGAALLGGVVLIIGVVMTQWSGLSDRAEKPRMDPQLVDRGA